MSAIPGISHLDTWQLIALAGAMGAAQAQVSDGLIKIGVLTDMSSLYTDLAGAGSSGAISASRRTPSRPRARWSTAVTPEARRSAISAADSEIGEKRR